MIIIGLERLIIDDVLYVYIYISLSVSVFGITNLLECLSLSVNRFKRTN